LGLPLVEKPKLIDEGMVIKVREGDSVTFPCRISNLEDFVVLWRKGSRVIFAGPIRVKRDERISLSGNNLVLKEVVAEDEGTSITLKCQAGGNPQPKLTWTRNGQILGGGERLKVKKLSPEGAGEYFCTAENGVGKPVNFKFTVEVFYKPRVQVVFEELRPGKVILTCDIKSEPESRVAWYHNGLHLNPSLGVSMGNQDSLYNLVVEGDVRDVVGEYKCRAENRLGAGEKIMIVRGEPTITSIDVQNLGWRRHVVSWETMSHLPVSAIRIKHRKIQDEMMGEKLSQWISEDISVSASQSSHELDNLWSDTQYEVSVSALNDLGWSPETVKTFNTVSHTPEQLQSLALERVGRASSFSCKNIPMSSTTLAALLSLSVLVQKLF